MVCRRHFFTFSNNNGVFFLNFYNGVSLVINELVLKQFLEYVSAHLRFGIQTDEKCECFYSIVLDWNRPIFKLTKIKCLKSKPNKILTV